MSIPIKACLFIKAHSDEQALHRLARGLKKNLAHGGFSIYPCECSPPCKDLTDE